ncbi:MAG TPA: DUF1843 domain-containing protein [Pyrinomonadaceae bacterium]|jgi:hypothetical protein|nr:DUF1843 domain-containing protein [Pyrinomonadaceae bacterium]
MPTSKGSTKKSATKKGGGKKATAGVRATSGAVPPYGPPIREAMARGDASEMRRVAASARKWIEDAQDALEKLEQRIARLGSK